uniref:ABC transporter domain-containing protein n=1 Tax=Amorphochlora amoebiformis TaxID=1561963 RepID=A0A7S0GRN0_9EUKA
MERGRSYLVVGRNRSGKSTLMKVLCRILDPSRMDITLNGRPFHTVERTHLRQMLSYVAQRPFIFEGTIAENIALGRTSAASEQVGKAAELAGVFMSELPTSAPNEDSQLARRGRKRMARPWARRPPFLQWIASRAWSLTLAGTHALRKALNTDPDPQDLNLELDYPLLSSKTRERLREQAEKIKKNLAAARLVALSSPTVQSPSEGPLSADDKRKVLEARTSTRGENLSGGFAQSVALARVFLRPEAQIVVLDEAMSQMDSVKRNTHVLPNLFRFVRKHNQTLIIVSHDVPTVAKHVDRIFVMDRGRCVHQGSHAELISKKSPEYLRLLSGRKELNLGEGESKTSFEMIGSHNRPPRHLGGPTAQRMFRGKLT